MQVEMTLGGRIAVAASYVEKDAVKALPGSRWEGGQWTVPRTWASCLALRGTFGDRLDVGPVLTAWSREEYDRRVAPATALRTAQDVPHGAPTYDDRLRPFQRAGVAWLLTSHDGALLGDDVGAGKTVQVCVALKQLGHRRGVVIAPKSTLPAWRDHLRDWAGLRPAVASGSAAKRRQAFEEVAISRADVVVLAWENVRGHSSLAGYGNLALSDEEKRPKELQHLQPEFVVLDEAQRCKDPRAKMTRAVWAVGDAPSVVTRIAATATPVGNALDDLWSIMRFVSPAEWPVKSKFVDRYCDMTWNRWGGMEVGGVKPATAHELYGFLDPRYRAMPKDVVLRDLPPRLGGLEDAEGRMVRWAEMGAKQEKAYRQMAADAVADLDGGRLLATGGLQRAARLLSLASAYGEVSEYTTRDEDGTERLHQRLTLSEPSCKLDALEDLLTGELSAEKSVVVFTVSRQLALLAAARAEKVTGRPARTIVGGQSDWEREEVIRGFQDKTYGTVVATIAAGGAGITLTAARVAVYLQRDFSYINNYQSEGRIHRIGSEVHDRVLYYDVLTPGTPDERVLQVLRTKQDVSSQVTRYEDLRKLFLGEVAVA